MSQNKIEVNGITVTRLPASTILKDLPRDVTYLTIGDDKTIWQRIEGGQRTRFRGQQGAKDPLLGILRKPIDLVQGDGDIGALREPVRRQFAQIGYVLFPFSPDAECPKHGSLGAVTDWPVTWCPSLSGSTPSAVPRRGIANVTTVYSYSCEVCYYNWSASSTPSAKDFRVYHRVGG